MNNEICGRLFFTIKLKRERDWLRGCMSLKGSSDRLSLNRGYEIENTSTVYNLVFMSNIGNFATTQIRLLITSMCRLHSISLELDSPVKI